MEGNEIPRTICYIATIVSGWALYLSAWFLILIYLDEDISCHNSHNGSFYGVLVDSYGMLSKSEERYWGFNLPA